MDDLPNDSTPSNTPVVESPELKIDTKLKLRVGDYAVIELARGKLNDAPSSSVAIMASRSFCPIGRESQTLVPEKSPLDNRLLSTFKDLGRKNFGDVLEIDTQGLLDSRLFVGVCPRDSLRRDETKEILLKIIFTQLRLGLQSGNSMNFEAFDGNTIFSIPRAQIAEVLFDACWYYCRKYSRSMISIRFLTTSKSLLELYAKTFVKRYQKLSSDLENAGPFNEDSPPSNFMLDTFQEDPDFIKTYGLHQKQSYNECGSNVTNDLYDAFVACEKYFSRPKHPILLNQIKYYLRDIHNATDSQINVIVTRRQKECQNIVLQAFEKHKQHPVEFFRNLCVYNLQFCKEILVKNIKEITSLDNMFLPPSQLAKMLWRYAGEESSDNAEEDPTRRSGATRSASDIFVSRKGRSASAAPKVKNPARKSASKLGLNASNKDLMTDTTPPIPEDVEPDRYAVLKSRLGPNPSPANWQKLTDLLYSSGGKVLDLTFDITQAADADKLAAALVRVYHFNDDALTLMKAAIKNEVDKTPTLSTLFRQNSVASKMMSTFSRIVSKSYLISVLSPTIQRVLEAGETLEVDPSKLKPGQNVETHQQNLMKVTEQLVQDIVKSVDQLPYACRAICHILKETVEPKFSDGALVAVAGFLVLRLINPALVVPDAEGLNILSKDKTAEARRGLLLVSKLIQNLANQVDFKKEEFMLIFNDFVTEKFILMEDFFLECATPCEPTEANKGDNFDLAPTQFHDSLHHIYSQLKLNKDKYISQLELDNELLEEFNSLLNNPIEPSVAAAPSTTPAAATNGKEEKKKDKSEKDKSEKDKGEKDKSKSDKDKIKEEEKKAKEAKKDEEKKAKEAKKEEEKKAKEAKEEEEKKAKEDKKSKK